MQDDMFRGRWNEIAGDLRHFFEKLSDEDIASIDGHGDRLMALLHMRYGYSDEKAQDAWDRFMNRFGHN